MPLLAVRVRGPFVKQHFIFIGIGIVSWMKYLSLKVSQSFLLLLIICFLGIAFLVSVFHGTGFLLMYGNPLLSTHI